MDDYEIMSVIWFRVFGYLAASPLAIYVVVEIFSSLYTVATKRRVLNIPSKRNLTEFSCLGQASAKGENHESFWLACLGVPTRI